MVTPESLGKVIAKGELTVSGRGWSRKVTLLIGKPRKTPGQQEYYCPYQIRGMGTDRIKRAYGIDSFQALQLTIRALAAELEKLGRDAGGRLHWLGEADDFKF
jgi:hypothetical protein